MCGDSVGPESAILVVEDVGDRSFCCQQYRVSMRPNFRGLLSLVLYLFRIVRLEGYICKSGNLYKKKFLKSEGKEGGIASLSLLAKKLPDLLCLTSAKRSHIPFLENGGLSVSRLCRIY